MRVLTLFAVGWSMLGGSAEPSGPSGPSCVDRAPLVLVHDGSRLELEGSAAMVHPAHGAAFRTPADQVLVETEAGPVALFDDTALPVHGACARAAVHAALRGSACNDRR